MDTEIELELQPVVYGLLEDIADAVAGRIAELDSNRALASRQSGIPWATLTQVCAGSSARRVSGILVALRALRWAGYTLAVVPIDSKGSGR